MQNPILKHGLIIALMLLLSTIYFNPQLKGKVLKQDDITAYKGAVQEKMTFEAKENRTVLWTNSMFCGMPTYQISSIGEGNLVGYLRVLYLGIDGPIGAFFSAMLCMYILLVLLKVNPWIAFIGAFAFGFTTNNIILWDAGHVTKVYSLTYIPLIIAGILMLYQSKYLLGAVVYMIGLSLNLLSNHIQMTYYFAITAIFLWILLTVLAFMKNNGKNAIISSLILLFGSIIAIGTAATNYLVTYEYQEDTMRGKPILAPKTDKEPGIQSSSETNGLSWDYATQWSAGTADLFTTLIPGLVGSRSGETADPKGDLVKLGVPKGTAVPLYFGSLPFTSGPNYISAIIFFFMIIGIVMYKEKWKWWLLFAIVITMFMAMGKHFELFNRLLFDHVPMFNKFRSPNSILGVTAIFTAILGALGINAFLANDSREERITALKIAGGITGGICILVAILGIVSVEADADAQLKEYGPQFLEALHSDRESYMKADAWRSIGFILAVAGLLWLVITNTLKKRLAIGLIAVIVIFDLFSVNKRYINDKSFISASKEKDVFIERPVDLQILADKDPHYRVFDLSINTFNQANSSYFHKTIGGYSAAKLQRYQDLIDYHITKNNSEVFNMLNTKYIITQEQQLSFNNQASGNAWFVGNIIKVNTPNQEIDALNNFKADSQAIVLDQEFDNYIGNFTPNKNGTIKLTKYAPDWLIYESNSNSEQFAVFSEIWYGPDKGWNAYIDGKLVPHIRTNYALRGLKIPAGTKKIEFKFEPKLYAVGVNIAYGSSIVILILGALGLVVAVIKGKKTD